MPYFSVKSIHLLPILFLAQQTQWFLPPFHGQKLWHIMGSGNTSLNMIMAIVKIILGYKKYRYLLCVLITDLLMGNIQDTATMSSQTLCKVLPGLIWTQDYFLSFFCFGTTICYHLNFKKYAYFNTEHRFNMFYFCTPAITLSVVIFTQKYSIFSWEFTVGKAIFSCLKENYFVLNNFFLT